MTDIYDLLPTYKETNIDIKYDFYKDYIKNNYFKDKLHNRIEYIKNKFNENGSFDSIIICYFVEIFSWSVLPQELLFTISDYLCDNNVKYIVDPCCGNSFHTFLFEHFCGFNVLSCDNQKEENAWTDIIEKDGIKFLDDLNEAHHIEGALLLSWIEGEELAFQLLENYIGDYLISIGNYTNNTRYMDDLNYYYELKIKINMNMPWGLKEKIEIYKRK